MREKVFTLFWKTGKVEIVKGRDTSEAMTLRGYSNGVLCALDFYAIGDKRKDYIWDTEKNRWVSKEILKMLN